MKQRILLLAFLLTAFFTASWAVVPTMTVVVDPAATPDATHFTTIQAALDAVTPASTINVAPGTYAEKLSITQSVIINGSSRAAVILDASALAGDAVSCRANNVQIRNLTLKGNNTAAGGAGFKMIGIVANAPLGTQNGTRASNVLIENVTVQDCRLSGIDYNGINMGSISNVEVKNSKEARGISISDCNSISLSGITTSGNFQASIGLTARGEYFPGGIDGVLLEGTNSLGDRGADLYTELDNPAYSIVNLDLSLDYMAMKAGATTFAYFATMDKAASVITDPSVDASVTSLAAVKSISMNRFYVRSGMKIQPALDNAADDSRIEIQAGTYNETVTITRNLTYTRINDTPAVAPEIVGTPGLTLGGLTINIAGGCTLPFPVKVTGDLTLTAGNLITSSTDYLELGPDAFVLGEASAKRILGDIHIRTLLTGSDAAPGKYYLSNIGCTISNLKENLGMATFIRRTGDVGVDGQTIDRVWLLYGNVTPTKPGTIKLTWFPEEDNGIDFGAPSGAPPAQVYTSMTGAMDGGGWTAVGSEFVGALRSVTFTATTGGYYTVFNADEPLPVELSTFTAAAFGKKIQLAWRTATEKNNYGFEIERRAQSAGEWQKIGFLAGAGTSNTPQSYAYTDNVGAGKYAYRLKQIDRDGKAEYSRVIEASAAFTPSDFGVAQNFPNPFNPSTVIRFAVKTAQHASLKIFNALGQEVRTLFDETAQPETMYALTFDATGLPSGSYYYMLRTADRTDVRRMMLLK